jgi:hypothetical protein
MKTLTENLTRFDIDFFMPSCVMPFLRGFILMSLCPLVICHSCQIWYWCVYALLWYAMLVRFDIDVIMPSFVMPFLWGLILMSLCPLLRCHSCQVWYWCLYAQYQIWQEWHITRGHKDINIKPRKNGITQEGIKKSISNLTRMASQRKA